MNFIPLATPDISEEDVLAVAEVLRSGMVVQGENVAAFEAEIADYLGVRHAVAVSNGTASLHLALVALGVGPGDEVIVPAFSFVATANAVELVGATCVFVDVQPDSWNLDPDQFRGALTERTRAVIPVHEFGLPCDIGKVVEIARERDIPVIEDAACALGAAENGKRVGGFGTVGSFSFHPRKAVTSGEGGILTTHDDDLARRFRILRNHGIEVQDGKTEFVAAGFNYRMTDFQAALVRGQLRRLPSIIARRETIAREYMRLLREENWLRLPHVPDDKTHSWQTFHLLLDPSIDRDRVVAGLAAAGIGSNLGAQCIPAQDYYRGKYAADSAQTFPNAWAAWRSGLALPLYSTMALADADRVASELRGVALL
jgi:dTDP-4-amino-4,6-dideoxygalactose transaminase